MATVHYIAKVRDNRTLELPVEACALDLKPGDEVHIFVRQEDAAPAETVSDTEQQERFRTLTAQLFAEANAVVRQPGIYSDPQKASVAEKIAEKQRRIRLKV